MDADNISQCICNTQTMAYLIRALCKVQQPTERVKKLSLKDLTFGSMHTSVFLS